MREFRLGGFSRHGARRDLRFRGVGFILAVLIHVRQPSPSFLALLVSLAGGLYVGRSLFPLSDPEREIARRVIDLENKSPEQSATGFGTAVTGERLEKWPEVEAGWKFMERAAADDEAAKGGIATVETNVGQLRVEFPKSEGAERLTLAAKLGRAWGTLSPPEAIAWADALSEPAEQSAAHQGIAQGWGGVEPLAASEWIAALPESPERQAIVSAFVKASAESCPRLALAFGLAVTDPAERAQLVGIALKPAAAMVPEEAQAMLSAAEISPREKEAFQESLSSHQSGGGGAP